MKETCQICQKDSPEVEGRDLWPREFGFLEFTRPDKMGSSGYAACSPECAAKLLERLMNHGEYKHKGKPSKSWKCTECRAVLPQNIFQEDGEYEHDPSGVPSLCLGKNTETVYFCSDACLLKHLRGFSIVMVRE